MLPFTLDFEEKIQHLRHELLEHGIYTLMDEISSVRLFMEDHVFAVWDFMSLLKALQRGLTCVDIPWLPPSDPRIARLINEIVLGEESDITPDGKAASHFDLYLQAMDEAGADTSRIVRFIENLRAGRDLETAFIHAAVPERIAAFIRHTFSVIEQGRLHEIAAAFTYGREDLIPGLFGSLIAKVDETTHGRLGTFHYYLKRHIELDGDEHADMGREMVMLLCGGDPVKEREACAAATDALSARLRLWNGISAHISQSKPD